MPRLDVWPGCVLWLLENVDVDTCPLYGASGGALAATLMACKINPYKAFDVANRLSKENHIFERPLGGTASHVFLDRQTAS